MQLNGTELTKHSHILLPLNSRANLLPHSLYQILLSLHLHNYVMRECFTIEPSTLEMMGTTGLFTSRV